MNGLIKKSILLGNMIAFSAIFTATPNVSAQAPSTTCLAAPTVGENASLTDFSDFWFGDDSYRFAIMLASNRRAGQDGIGFIGNPDALSAGTKVCIPRIAEADRLRRRYDRYVEAVADMTVAQPWEEVDTLKPLPQNGTYQVATWIRSDQISNYPDAPSGGFNFSMPGDVWVTLEPYLGNFCKQFVRDVSPDPEALTVRLEQRLGLPPVSAKTHFAIFEIDADDANGGQRVFRPCGNTTTDTNSCEVGNPEDSQFFYRQYYQSYGTTLPMQYPWTSLGYTFDWAPDQAASGNRAGFSRVGESEYVVPKGTSVKFIGVKQTANYCAP